MSIFLFKHLLINNVNIKNIFIHYSLLQRQPVDSI